MWSLWYFLQGFRSPLLMAASKGHSEVVSLLLERGANTEARDFAVRTSWVMIAVRITVFILRYVFYKSEWAPTYGWR